jgi:hypothetical protein
MMEASDSFRQSPNPTDPEGFRIQIDDATAPAEGDAKPGGCRRGFDVEFEAERLSRR